CFSLFLFTALAPPVLFPLSLHDALPIFTGQGAKCAAFYWVASYFLSPTCLRCCTRRAVRVAAFSRSRGAAAAPRRGTRSPQRRRSEEHTSELQSQSNLVCRLLLEKKKHK